MDFNKESADYNIKKIQSGESSCAEWVSASLDAIEQHDKTIRAFTSVQKEAALNRAKIIDNMGSDEKSRLPLCGAPIAVKDNICTEGVPTTCSSKMLANFVPPYSATVVTALEKAGAIIVGKTNLDEFAMGSSTETSAIGPTRNPHSLAHTPGGSSGGSAAAVAAGFVPFALGSDTGGSIRLPASFCGVVGLKPTYGRVSRYGLVAFASSLDQIGPLSVDVRDAGTLLSVLATPDNRDATYAGEPFVNDPSLYCGHAKGMKIGVPKEYFGNGLSASVREPVEALMNKLSAAGAVLTPVTLPYVEFAVATYYIICTAEASSNLARYDGVKYGYRSASADSLIDMYESTRHEGFGAEVKRRIMLGTYVLSSGYYDAYYLKAAKVRTLIARDFENAFGECDAIISPVAPTPAFPIGENCDDPLAMYLMDIYTVSANLAGIPAMSVPCGKAGDLPIGVQFMAPKWREDTLLRLGFAVQTLQ